VHLCCSHRSWAFQTRGLGFVQGRQEIYAVHARGKKLAEGLSFERIGRATAGFTGADIMNLMNQAAIQTVREVSASLYGVAHQMSGG
jgi:ATP-dependent 26S proteasome regulatory subunit